MRAARRAATICLPLTLTRSICWTLIYPQVCPVKCGGQEMSRTSAYVLVRASSCGRTCPSSHGRHLVEGASRLGSCDRPHRIRLRQDSVSLAERCERAELRADGRADADRGLAQREPDSGGSSGSGGGRAG